MTYKWMFAILKIEMLKISLSAVKGIGRRSVIKGTLNGKVGPGRPRTSTTKHDHRLKMSILKGTKKRLSTTAKINSFS